jgi:hypothetical protein
MFFCNRFDKCKLIIISGLRDNTLPKLPKHDRTMSFFGRGHRVFLPNRVIAGSFLIVKLFNNMQVVIKGQLAGIEKTLVASSSCNDMAHLSVRTINQAWPRAPEEDR